MPRTPQDSGQQEMFCLYCGHDIDAHDEYNTCEVCQESLDGMPGGAQGDHVESCPSSLEFGLDDITTPDMSIVPKRVYMIDDEKGVFSSELDRLFPNIERLAEECLSSSSSSSPSSPSSPRATRRIEKEKTSSLTTTRHLLLSSLLSISAVPISSFPEDEQKTVLVTLKEITEGIRGLRKRLS